MNGFGLKPEWFGRKIITAALVACLLQMGAFIHPAESQTKEKKINYLKSLSIEELLQTEVTSVSKKSEPIFDTAAAVFVITQEDILRSGARSIPEALRMVPGLQVAQIDANKWVITSRGFADRFSNKLLVLMDDRSVYTPLFSGVYWDAQDTLLEDIERIEVIRGAGATLWVANAVNGVINIITKSARDTQGELLSAGIGSHETSLDGARYGGQMGDETFFHIYGKGFRRDDFENHDGGSANDNWGAARGGFKLETKPSERDELTFQGDIYQNKANQTATVDSYLTSPLNRPVEDNIDVYGLNLIGRWKKRTSDTSNLMLQLYYDRTSREEILLNEVRDTIDLEFQHQWKPFERHDVIWGVGYRYTTDETEGSFNNLLDPEDRNDQLFSAFAQDDILMRIRMDSKPL